MDFTGWKVEERPKSLPTTPTDIVVLGMTPLDHKYATGCGVNFDIAKLEDSEFNYLYCLYNSILKRCFRSRSSPKEEKGLKIIAFPGRSLKSPREGSSAWRGWSLSTMDLIRECGSVKG